MYICSILWLADQAVKRRISVGADTALGIGEMLNQCVFFNGTLGIGGKECPGKQGNKEYFFQFHDFFEQLKRILNTLKKLKAKLPVLSGT
jgi:hypothetical protein